MAIIDSNNNVNREAEDKLAEHLQKIASSLVSGTCHVLANAKKTLDDINKETEAYFDEQARMQARRQFIQAQHSIQVLIALGLNNMPPHMKFLGNVSPHSIKVSQLDNGLIRADVPCDMTDSPKHFHIFRNVLQDVLDSLYREAIDTLRDRIRADAWHIQDLIMAGQWNIIEESRVMKEYNDLYRSIMERLFSVRVVSVQRQSGGISIDIETVFNDMGLSPNNYPSNIQACM